MLRIVGFLAAGIFLSMSFVGRASAQNLSGGIGIGIQFDDRDNCVIGPVMPGGPAETAGIKAGDVLLAVGDRKLEDIDEDELPKLIRGEAGTEVVLTVRNGNGEVKQVSVKRAILGQPDQPNIPREEKDAKPQAAPAREDAQPAPQAAHPDGTMKFTHLAIHDPGINNIEAVSLLVPVGWKADGGIKWYPDLSVLAMLLMKISDPQSGAEIEYLPIQNFTFLSNPVFPMQRGTNYMGCIVWEPIGDLHELVQTFYTEKFTPQLKDAKLIGQEELPKIEQIVAAKWGGQSKVKSGRVRYEYLRDGKPWEEDVYITAVYTPSQLGVFWSVTSSHAFRAPKGQLDKFEPIMNTTVNTAKLNPDWFSGYMYVQKLFNNRMMQGIKDAAALSATITKNNEEIRKMNQDAYNERQASQDRISEGFSEYIRGVETYKNPYEDRQVQLPSGYNDAWVNNKGEYFLSNQAGFDPNVGDTSEWRRMDRRN